MAHILCGGVDAVTERIDSKTEAENVAGACLNGQALVTSVVKEEKTVGPPKLYDAYHASRGMPTAYLVLLQSRLWSTPRAFMKRSCVPIPERTVSICLTIWSRQPEV